MLLQKGHCTCRHVAAIPLLCRGHVFQRVCTTSAYEKTGRLLSQSVSHASFCLTPYMTTVFCFYLMLDVCTFHDSYSCTSFLTWFGDVVELNIDGDLGGSACLVSSWCCNKWPQTGWLEAAGVNFLTVLEAQCRSKWQLVQKPSRGSRENHSMTPLSYGGSWSPWA